MQTLFVVLFIVILSWACSVMIEKYAFTPEASHSPGTGKSMSNSLENIWWFVQVYQPANQRPFSPKSIIYCR
eukprot:m.154420 g.154420  ORF g.154420 m.154420 type:complete len:72 (+) comp38641_c0_seq8:444-659(+)